MIRFGRRGARNESEASSPFEVWFKGSVVVKRDGSPRLVYHQTTLGGSEAIRRQGFDIGRVGMRKGDEHMPDGIFLKFHDQPIGVAKASPTQMALYVSIQNPLRVENREELETWLRRDGAYRQVVERLAETNRRGHAAWEADWATMTALGREVAQTAACWRIHRHMRMAGDRWRDEANELAAEARVHVTNILVEQGYDGLWMKKDVGTRGMTVETLVVLDPDRIRLVEDVRALPMPRFRR